MATTTMPLPNGLPELHPLRFDRSESAAIKDHLTEHGVRLDSCIVQRAAAARLPTVTVTCPFACGLPASSCSSCLRCS
jgi:hypothetical protein